MSESAELFEIIKATKHLIIIVTLIVTFLSAIHFSRVIFEYRSTVSFFIDDQEGQGLRFNEIDDNSLVQSKVDGGNRLYHLAKSTEMLDYLIQKFHLYNHYDVDVNNPLAYESVTATLKDNIIVKKTSGTEMSITVKDVDRVVAANIANEVFYKLNEMNKDFIISKAESKINIYSQVFSGIKKKSPEEYAHLEKLADECENLVSGKSRFSEEAALLSDLKIKLEVLSVQLNSVNVALVQTIKEYKIAAADLQKENIPGFRLINIAMADTRSPVTYAFLWTFALSVATLYLMTSFVVFFHEYEPRLKAILN